MLRCHAIYDTIDSLLDIFIAQISLDVSRCTPSREFTNEFGPEFSDHVYFSLTQRALYFYVTILMVL